MYRRTHFTRLLAISGSLLLLAITFTALAAGSFKFNERLSHLSTL